MASCGEEEEVEEGNGCCGSARWWATAGVGASRGMRVMWPVVEKKKKKRGAATAAPFNLSDDKGNDLRK